MLYDEFANCENNIRIDGKVALVTGGTSGIGLEIAKNLAKRGAKVIISGRSIAKMDTAKTEIIQDSGNDQVVTGQMDFESLSSIRNFAADTIKTEPRLDILINNIGAMGLDDKLTADNLHLMMQVNYFGDFLLTFLLFPLLKVSAPSRVIHTSSSASYLGDIDFENWNKVGKYSSFGYYSNAKVAVILSSEEMDRRVKGSGVSFLSIDPGISRSNLFTNSVKDPIVNFIINKIVQNFGRDLERVATMPVYVAIDPKLGDKSGKHFRDCMEFFDSWFSNDRVFIRKLWDESKKLVNITAEEDWEIKT